MVDKRRREARKETTFKIDTFAIVLKYSSMYIKMFRSVIFINAVTQFRVTIPTNSGALKRCMNVSYVVCPERASSLLLQCIICWYSVSNVNILLIFEVQKVKLSL